jgi:hypothetical protein
MPLWPGLLTTLVVDGASDGGVEAEPNEAETWTGAA